MGHYKWHDCSCTNPMDCKQWKSFYREWSNSKGAWIGTSVHVGELASGVSHATTRRPLAMDLMVVLPRPHLVVQDGWYHYNADDTTFYREWSNNAGQCEANCGQKQCVGC